MKFDRRHIAPMLKTYFPEMEKATSDEWHGFLNAQTGLDIAPDEMNATAFDKWRMALAEQGLPVWPYSTERMAAIKARGEELKLLEDKRREDLGKTLSDLAKEAPEIPAREMLKKR